MKIASLIISLIALVLVLVLFHRVGAIEDRSSAGTRAPSVTEDHGAGEEEPEVAVFMGRIQNYHQKLWLACRAGDHELVAFYLHEMEETMQELANAEIVDDGVDVSSLMRTYGLNTIKHFERKLKEEGVQAVQAEGDMLVGACNTCHQATGHATIKIRVPDEFSIPDQVFAP